MTAILEVINLTKSFRSLKAVDDISFSIPRGVCFGLLGPNGAGKSTLMKAIIGEIEPDDGEISKPSKARIGYIAQDAPSGSTTPEDAVLEADVERIDYVTPDTIGA